MLYKITVLIATEKEFYKHLALIHKIPKAKYNSTQLQQRGKTKAQKC